VLAPASCDVVDGRHADGRDQKLSSLAGLAHADTKAHPGSLFDSNARSAAAPAAALDPGCSGTDTSDVAV
jgi:hypothetical protein